MACSGALCMAICGTLCVGGCATGCSVTVGIGFGPASFFSATTASASAAGTALAQGN